MIAADKWTPDLEASLNDLERHRLAGLRKQGDAASSDAHEYLLTIARLRTDLARANERMGGMVPCDGMPSYLRCTGCSKCRPI